jgi:hypothetical protein
MAERHAHWHLGLLVVPDVRQGMAADHMSDGGWAAVQRIEIRREALAELAVAFAV